MMQFTPMAAPQLGSGGPSPAQSLMQLGQAGMQRFQQMRQQRGMARPHRDFPAPHQQQQLEINPHEAQ